MNSRAGGRAETSMEIACWFTPARSVLLLLTLLMTLLSCRGTAGVASAGGEAGAADGSWDWEDTIGGTTRKCRWARFKPPIARRGDVRRRAQVCIRPGKDILSDAIAKYQYWDECADLPLLHAFAAGTDDSALFVDVGANIGACSLHVLLASAAPPPIVAFEPSEDNLFFFTSSLLLWHQRSRSDSSSDQTRGLERPSLGPSRFTLYPFALGSADTSRPLHQAKGNGGHARIATPGEKATRWAPYGLEPEQAVRIRTLDSVLWPDRPPHRTASVSAAAAAAAPPPKIALLKLDVEGYECLALQGMSRLLEARAIRAIKVEVFDELLRLQGCSAIALQRALVAHGYELHLAPSAGAVGEQTPRVAEQTLVAAIAATPLSADVVHGRAEQYNLYATLPAGVVL